MTDDITDTGPLEWSKTSHHLTDAVPHIIIGACAVLIVTMLLLWGGQ